MKFRNGAFYFKKNNFEVMVTVTVIGIKSVPIWIINGPVGYYWDEFRGKDYFVEMISCCK
jgi:hypothetical protein